MLFLASKSPRRKELLKQLGCSFELISAEIDETPLLNESPINFVKRMAHEKAQAGWQQLAQRKASENWVLGSDTIVVINEVILGKPKSFEHFCEMLASLSGQTHQVMTSVALVSGNKKLTDTVITNVTFKELSQQDILAYWQTNEPQDKAGGYGIQGIAGKFVTHIEGSYFSVVGLPLYETELLLAQAQQINRVGE